MKKTLFGNDNIVSVRKPCSFTTAAAASSFCGGFSCHLFSTRKKKLTMELNNIPTRSTIAGSDRMEFNHGRRCNALDNKSTKAKTEAKKRKYSDTVSSSSSDDIIGYNVGKG